jgi:hypothetical protein
MSLAEGGATANLVGHFPVEVRSGEDRQVQHWVRFDVRLGERRENKHLILVNSLLEDFIRRNGFSVLDDEEFLSQLFVTRFNATTWSAVDLVVRPIDLESVLNGVGN